MEYNATAPRGMSFKKAATLAACLLVQLCVGILYLWSIFNERVQIHYSWPADSANMVASYMMFAFVSGNLLGGILQDKTNPRITAAIGSLLFCCGILATSFLTESTIGLIYLTYSTMAGIGCGFVYGSVLNCLQKWFPNRRGFASGLAVASFALSTVVFAPLSQLLLNNYGVPKTFLILGISFLVIAAVACIFISLPPSDTYKSQLPGLTPRQAMKKLSFWCIAITCFFANATWNILMPDIVSLGMARQLSAETATLALMITGIANVLGRFSMASLSDKIGREIAVIITSVLTFCCAIVLIWAQGSFYLIAVALTAFAYGGPSATLPAMCADTCGPRYNGTNYGIALLGLGFSSIVFKSLSNFIEKSGFVTGGSVRQYTLSFILAAATCVIPVVLMLLYRRLTKKQDYEKSDTKPADIEPNSIYMSEKE